MDGNTDCTPAAVTLATDASEDHSIDFGVVGIDTACLGSIGDRIWDDRDEDGLQGEGEPGLNGFVVTLKDEAGATLATTCSGFSPADAPGWYSFPGLCAGSYTIEVAERPGWEPAVPCSQDPLAADDSNCLPAAVILTVEGVHYVLAHSLDRIARRNRESVYAVTRLTVAHHIDMGCPRGQRRSVQ